MLSDFDKHLGYLTIDHRASPGVNEEFIRGTGKPALFVPGGAFLERDTYSCAHCQTVVIKNPLRQRARNVCMKCMKVVCDNPGCATECRPFEQLIDTLQERAYKDSHLT